MPKPSLLIKDAAKGGGGFGAMEGVWEIGNVYSSPYQFPASEDMKAKHEEYPKSTMVILELYKLDPSNLERVDDTPAHERLGFGNKATMDLLRPGKMASPEDDDPTDLGREDGVEGNSLYCEPGLSIPDNCGWMIFSKDLEEKGFKASILATGWLPYLIGTKFKVKRHAGYKKPGKTYKVDPTNLGVEEIYVKGYEVQSGKSAAKATAKSNGQAGKATTKAPEAEVPLSEEHQKLASEAVAVVAKKLSGTTIKRPKLQAEVMALLLKSVKDMKERSTILDQTIKNDEWLIIAGAENGFELDQNEGSVTFS